MTKLIAPNALKAPKAVKANIYGDTIIMITNNIMRCFLQPKYSGYLQETNLETMKQATYQFITLYLITIQGQKQGQKQGQTPVPEHNVQSIIRNTTCERILAIWFQQHYLNQTINDEILYNKLYVKLDTFIKQFG